MSAPAYHLRPNKAVDRLAFIDVIRRLERMGHSLEKYTYHGMGGPYLEDFRLLYEFFPEIRMVSVDNNTEIIKRQQFHRPCNHRRLKLLHSDMRSYISSAEIDDQKSIFWLDFTNLENSNFEDFETLLRRLSADSIVKISLNASPQRFLNRRASSSGTEEFRNTFESYLPNPSVTPTENPEEFSMLLQEMLKVATQRALPAESQLSFQLLSSFYYRDGARMFSLTGYVCQKNETKAIAKIFQSWELANLNWSQPKQIDVPTFSTKERLHLQQKLPSGDDGTALFAALKYLVTDDLESTKKQLEQYGAFHRHLPYFMKITP